MIFLDLSNAFDRVPHDKLLEKLSAIGITGDYLIQIKNTLTGRKQFINLKDISSIPKSINSRVAQGGVLSPLEYNIYVSDLPSVLKCNNFEFADDTLLIKIIRNISDINSLQNDINNVEQYCEANELMLNVQKTKHLRVGLKDCNFPNYKIFNESIETVNSHKHLGVTYDAKMSFNNH